MLNIPRGYFDNFLLKVNGKYDGTNQCLDREAFSGLGFKSRETMLLAYDVNHPGRVELSNHSVVAVVGSLNDNFSKYSCSMAKQVKTREEMVQLNQHVVLSLEE